MVVLEKSRTALLVKITNHYTYRPWITQKCIKQNDRMKKWYRWNPYIAAFSNHNIYSRNGTYATETLLLRANAQHENKKTNIANVREPL